MFRDETLRTLRPARHEKGLNGFPVQYWPCPKCGDSYAAIICPICKIPIDPNFERSSRAARELQEAEHYPYLFYI